MCDAADPGGTARRLTVAEVLVSMGFDVRPDRSGLIRSPFRDERTPSFHILPPGYGWKDFGDGSGGGVIDLVMRLKGCSRQAAIDTLARIRSGEDFFSVRERASVHNPVKPRAPRLQVVSVEPLTDPALLSYARSRGITDEITQLYCRQVLLRTSREGGESLYLGFPNGAGGWVLRSTAPGRAGKRCTISAPTFIGPDGSLITEPAGEAVAVFEGFFDFLSYMRLCRQGSVLPGMDAAVLNSVVNAGRALEFITSHSSVNLWLDNDDAGREAAVRIARAVADAAPNAQVYDHAYEYGGFKDLNEYLLIRSPRR